MGQDKPEPEPEPEPEPKAKPQRPERRARDRRLTQFCHAGEHLMTPENTRWFTSGYWGCRECIREYERKRRERRRQERQERAAMGEQT